MNAGKQDITDRKASLLEKFFIWLIPLILTLFQRLYGLTIRQVHIGREPVDKLRSEGKSFIYGLWHTNVILTPYLLRKEKFFGLVSKSKDGEMITRVLRHFNNDAIRGSSSKGGVQGLRNIIKTLQKGHTIAITPDGPRGPALELKEGIIYAARASGVPIIPFYYAATSQWVLHKSWDEHIIPKPFSTLIISYGPPIDIQKLSKNHTDQELKAAVQKKLMKNMEKCRKELQNTKNRTLKNK